MQTVLIVLLSIFTIMETFAQNITTDRQPVAAGRFYPADKETLTRDLSQLFEKCKKSPSKLNVRAIISPHAGYIFSGKTAAAAYSSIPKNAVFLLMCSCWKIEHFITEDQFISNFLVNCNSPKWCDIIS